MTEISDLIKSFTKEDYEQGRVNLHIHSSYSDGRGIFLDITRQARLKYKHFSVTDHNTVQGHIDFPQSGSIVGAEFDVWYKYIFLHILAYGFNPSHLAMERFYSKNKIGTEADIIRIFTRRNIKELIAAIHAAGGIAVLAHPACCWAPDMDKFIKELKDMGLDGVEVYYPYPRWRKYIKFSSPSVVAEIADKYGLIKTGGTDCHAAIL